MALSGKISTTIRGREYRIEWSAVQDIAKNTSTITCVHKLINDPKFDLYIDKRSNSCTVGSDVKSYTSAEISTEGGSTITLGTTVHTVTHDSDGTKTVTIKGVFNIQATLSGNYVSSLTATDTVTLDTIPRVSKPTVSASSVQMGNSVTIYTNRKADTMTHTLTYSFGGSTGTIATDVRASVDWTVPDLVSKISGKTSGTCTITCTTYSGTTLIGSDTVSITLTVPAKSKPTASEATVQMGSSVTIYTNRKSTGYTHTLTYSIGNASGTIATGVGASVNWAVPDLASKIAGSTSGTCTITCQTYTGTTLVGSDTVSITLTVQEKSKPTVSASTVQMGNSVTICTNSNSAGFTHALTYSFGGVTGTIATGVGASYEWTVPDLASRIAGNTSGACTITCKTYSGSTLVGSDTVSLTLTIPAKSTPTVSASTVKMGNSVNIYTNRKSAGFTHTLTYAIGGATGTIGTGVETVKAWTVPTSLAANTGNKTSATCTITCQTYNGSKLVGSDTVTLTLTVPDATTVNVNYATVTLGDSILIYTPRQSEAYVHDLTYSLTAKGSSTVVATGTIRENVTTDYTWAVPLDLAAKIPSATEGTITVTCKTKIGSSTTEIGTSTKPFGVTVPDNTTTKPKVTMALAPVSDLSSTFSGIYVQGKSKVKVTHTATSSYSTIASYQTTVNGAKGTSNPYTSAILANEGTVTVTGKVTDARGYYTELQKSIEVIPYGRPRVVPGSGQSKIVCTRCNSDGSIDPGGVYLLIKVGRSYHKVVSGGTQKNYCKLSYRYKVDGAEESQYSSATTLLEKTASADYVSVVLSGIVSSNITAYNIQLIAEDDVGEKDTVTITVPTAFVTFHVPAGGHGFTLGGYHDPEDEDVFGCFFDAKMKKTLSVADSISGANFNGVYMKGVSLTSNQPSHFKIDTKLTTDTNGNSRSTIFMLGSNGGSELVMGGLWFRSNGACQYTGSGTVTLEHLGSNKFKVKLGNSVWDYFVFLSSKAFEVTTEKD
jgi:hypothetical protein